MINTQTMKSFKRIALTSLIASATNSLVLSTAYADLILGADAEIAVWAPEYDAGNTIDSLFGEASGEDISVFASATLEHPVPVLPNAKISLSRVDNDQYEYTKIDYTGYYEILDNDTITVDVGAGVTQFDSGEYLGQSFSAVTPHVYVDAEVSLPFTNTTFYTDIHYFDIDGNQITDAIAGVRYDFDLIAADLGVKAGYRVQRLDTDDLDDLDLNVKTDGLFLGVHADF